MPIIIKAKGNDSTNDVIKKFKKAVASADVVQKAKNRTYFQKPSQVKAAKTSARSRMRRRLHSMKRMKNISPETLQRIASML